MTSGNYRLSLYASLGKFFDALQRQPPDVLLMDMHLPGMDGREILRAIRANAKTKRMILIGLSDRPRSNDEATAAFKAGADEYFFKPLESELIGARLQSLLRATPTPASEACLRHSGIAVFPESRGCHLDGREIRLTRLEFDILLEFIRNPNRVLTRNGLIDALWSGDSSRGARAVDRHVSALRGKLGVFGQLLETLVGVGYRLADAAAKPSSRAARK